MNSNSEFHVKCRSASPQQVINHLTSCLENRHRAIRIAIEPEDPVDFLDALETLINRISNSSHEPVVNDADKRNLNKRIQHATRLFESEYSDLEVYFSRHNNRFIFRSELDRRNHFSKLRALFDTRRKRLELEIERCTLKLEIYDNERLQSFERGKESLLFQCEALRMRGDAWKNESRVSQIPWVILPRGALDSGPRDQSRQYGEMSRICESRLNRILCLNPARIFKGVHEFSGYFAFTFEDSEWVIFESNRVGNALYVVRGDWVAMSRMTKMELLSHSSRSVRRIVHKGDWFGQLEMVMKFLWE